MPFVWKKLNVRPSNNCQRWTLQTYDEPDIREFHTVHRFLPVTAYFQNWASPELSLWLSRKNKLVTGLPSCGVHWWRQRGSNSSSLEPFMYTWENNKNPSINFCSSSKRSLVQISNYKTGRVSTWKNLTFPSKEAVARAVPSGENEAAEMGLVWPVISRRQVLRDSGSLWGPDPCRAITWTNRNAN